MNFELCTKCDYPTGRAGPSDDSLIVDGQPYCEHCYTEALEEKVETQVKRWPEDHPCQFPCIILVSLGGDSDIEIADNFEDGYWDVRGQGQWEIESFPEWVEPVFPFPTYNEVVNDE